VSKETFYRVKRDLLWSKRGLQLHDTTEPGVLVLVGKCFGRIAAKCQKRPATEAKETYYGAKEAYLSLVASPLLETALGALPRMDTSSLKMLRNLVNSRLRKCWSAFAVLQQKVSKETHYGANEACNYFFLGIPFTVLGPNCESTEMGSQSPSRRSSLRWALRNC
jgi:hypothetical protein